MDDADGWVEVKALGMRPTAPQVQYSIESYADAAAQAADHVSSSERTTTSASASVSLAGVVDDCEPEGAVFPRAGTATTNHETSNSTSRITAATTSSQSQVSQASLASRRPPPPPALNDLSPFRTSPLASSRFEGLHDLENNAAAAAGAWQQRGGPDTPTRSVPLLQPSLGGGAGADAYAVAAAFLQDQPQTLNAPLSAADATAAAGPCLHAAATTPRTTTVATTTKTAIVQQVLECSREEIEYLKRNQSSLFEVVTRQRGELEAAGARLAAKDAELRSLAREAVLEITHLSTKVKALEVGSGAGSREVFELYDTEVAALKGMMAKLTAENVALAQQAADREFAAVAAAAVEMNTAFRDGAGGAFSSALTQHQRSKVAYQALRRQIKFLAERNRELEAQLEREQRRARVVVLHERNAQVTAARIDQLRQELDVRDEQLLEARMEAAQARAEAARLTKEAEEERQRQRASAAGCADAGATVPPAAQPATGSAPAWSCQTADASHSTASRDQEPRGSNTKDLCTGLAVSDAMPRKPYRYPLADAAMRAAAMAPAAASQGIPQSGLLLQPPSSDQISVSLAKTIADLRAMLPRRQERRDTL